MINEGDYQFPAGFDFRRIQLPGGRSGAFRSRGQQFSPRDDVRPSSHHRLNYNKAMKKNRSSSSKLSSRCKSRNRSYKPPNELPLSSIRSTDHGSMKKDEEKRLVAGRRRGSHSGSSKSRSPPFSEERMNPVVQRDLSDITSEEIERLKDKRISVLNEIVDQMNAVCARTRDEKEQLSVDLRKSDRECRQVKKENELMVGKLTAAKLEQRRLKDELNSSADRISMLERALNEKCKIENKLREENISLKKMDQEIQIALEKHLETARKFDLVEIENRELMDRYRSCVNEICTLKKLQAAKEKVHSSIVENYESKLKSLKLELQKALRRGGSLMEQIKIKGEEDPSMSQDKNVTSQENVKVRGLEKGCRESCAATNGLKNLQTKEKTCKEKNETSGTSLEEAFGNGAVGATRVVGHGKLEKSKNIILDKRRIHEVGAGDRMIAESIAKSADEVNPKKTDKDVMTELKFLEIEHMEVDTLRLKKRVERLATQLSEEKIRIVELEKVLQSKACLEADIEALKKENERVRLVATELKNPLTKPLEDQGCYESASPELMSGDRSQQKGVIYNVSFIKSLQKENSYIKDTNASLSKKLQISEGEKVRLKQQIEDCTGKIRKLKDEVRRKREKDLAELTEKQAKTGETCVRCVKVEDVSSTVLQTTTENIEEQGGDELKSAVGETAYRKTGASCVESRELESASKNDGENRFLDDIKMMISTGRIVINYSELAERIWSSQSDETQKGSLSKLPYSLRECIGSLLLDIMDLKKKNANQKSRFLLEKEKHEELLKKLNVEIDGLKEENKRLKESLLLPVCDRSNAWGDHQDQANEAGQSQSGVTERQEIEEEDGSPVQVKDGCLHNASPSKTTDEHVRASGTRFLSRKRCSSEIPGAKPKKHLKFESDIECGINSSLRVDGPTNGEG